MNLSKSNHCGAYIEELALQTVFDKAKTVEERDQEEISAGQIAELLRTFSKPIRVPLMQALTEEDEALAEQVKSKLFSIRDLANLQDRDVQAVLAECKTPDLVVGLQECEEEILVKVFSNMSKRAKETLQEEMELAGQTKAEEIAAGRERIVKVIMELDEAGKISLE